MVRAIDAAIPRGATSKTQKIREDSNVATTVDLKKIFDGFDHEQYEEETKQRWGNTQGYKAAEKRWKSLHGSGLAQACKEEQGAIYAAAFAALKAGVAPTTSARWMWPKVTGCVSTAGSIRAVTQCTRTSPTCTRPTIGSARSSTSTAGPRCVPVRRDPCERATRCEVTRGSLGAESRGALTRVSPGG